MAKQTRFVLNGFSVMDTLYYGILEFDDLLRGFFVNACYVGANDIKTILLLFSVVYYNY